MKKSFLLAFLVFTFNLGVFSQVTINVTYSPNNGVPWPNQAQVAFQRAVNAWQNTISSPYPIRVEAFFAPNGTNQALAVTSTSFGRFSSAIPNNPPLYTADTHYPVALLEKVANNTYTTANLPFHFTIRMNSSFNWHFGPTIANTSARQYDFTTTSLHEIGHGLAFTSTASQVAFTPPTPAPPATYNNVNPLIYDRFVYRNVGGVYLTSLGGSSAQTNSYLISEQLFWDGVKARTENNSSRPRIYAPNPWEQGSSIAHWNQGQFNFIDNDAVMHPQLGFTNQNLYRDIGNVTEGMLCDIGWTLATSIRENSINDEGLITLYPNPNYNGNLFIYSTKNVTNCSIEIYNSLGELLHQENLKSLDSKSINFSFINGIYFIKVMQGNEVISTEKIIKL